MIDSITSLAFSVYSGKGVYAFLLGSGVSRASQIPTGWEVTLDLIRRVAQVQGEDCEPDPAAWYSGRYGAEANYSLLLEELAVTPAERLNMLSAYFEPTEDERSEGRKLPTRAHYALAALVSRGYVRVILTTNFDRLTEQALQAAGVNPGVISTSDMVHGALPLAHAQCTVIKLHGDYKDTRLRNTAKELQTYDSETEKLLDRILDEYGLVVCGWSATWDEALRNALLRSPNRRFTTFWAAKGDLNEEANQVVKFRQASIIAIKSADQFLEDLREKIDALEKFDAPHPLSKLAAIASLKKYVADEQHRIQLHDLLMDEVERQLGRFLALSVQIDRVTWECAQERLVLYEVGTDVLASLIAHGCYWGQPSHIKVWVKTITRMLDAVSARSGNSWLIKVQRYPASILAYAAGIACLAGSNYATLKAIFRDARTPVDINFEGKDAALVRKIGVDESLDGDQLNRWTNQRKHTPASDRIHGLLRETFRPLLPNDTEYDEAFDRFEYLFALAYLDAKTREEGMCYAPIGRFAWRSSSKENHISHALPAEYEREGLNWPPLKAGLFDSHDHFTSLANTFREEVLRYFNPRIGWVAR